MPPISSSSCANSATNTVSTCRARPVTAIAHFPSPLLAQILRKQPFSRGADSDDQRLKIMRFSTRPTEILRRFPCHGSRDGLQGTRFFEVVTSRPTLNEGLGFAFLICSSGIPNWGGDSNDCQSFPTTGIFSLCPTIFVPRPVPSSKNPGTNNRDSLPPLIALLALNGALSLSVLIWTGGEKTRKYIEDLANCPFKHIVKAAIYAFVTQPGDALRYSDFPQVLNDLADFESMWSWALETEPKPFHDLALARKLIE
ncbi:hypothetical protein DFH09DRAFT_1315708 [Mycena vulgaris]|nr:hypothetical protein DFH09DRAFT_1315708 [Mycena vulgaris]